MLTVFQEFIFHFKTLQFTVKPIKKLRIETATWENIQHPFIFFSNKTIFSLKFHTWAFLQFKSCSFFFSCQVLCSRLKRAFFSLKLLISAVRLFYIGYQYKNLNQWNYFRLTNEHSFIWLILCNEMKNDFIFKML